MSEVEAPVQTLDELIKRGIQNAIQSQAILEAVQKHAEKAVSEAVRSAFDYGSEFRKGIESAIREVLPVIKAEELAQFSVAVREVIQRRLGNLANATAKQHLDEMLQKILPESAEITLEELEQQFKAKVKDSRREPGCHCDDDDEESLEYTWNIDNSQSSVCDGYWDLTAGMSPDASRYSSKDVINLRFRGIKEQPGLHECWMASVGSNGIGVNSLFSGPLYGFDALVFRLATGQSKLRYGR